MLVFGIIALFVTSFALGILIAEIVNNRNFWNRQNFMEKINRKF